MNKMDEMEREDLVAPRRGGGFFGKLIALLLGFILGVVGGIGGIGYAGYYAATQVQIQQGVDYLNTYAGLNIDYTQFVNGKYGEATIADLIGEVANAVTEIANGNGSLNTLNEISPYVAKLILGEAGSEDSNGLISKLQELGLEIDGEALMNRILVKPSGISDKNPDVYLTDYLIDSATSIEVVKVLEMVNVEVNDMLALICYDGDRALTIGELMTMDMFAKLSNIPLETVLKPTPGNVIMMHLSYGASNRYTVDGDTITMSQMYFSLNGEGNKAFDDQGAEVENGVISQVNGDTCVLTITEGEKVTTYYLKAGAGDKYYAYEDSAFTTEVAFPKVTLATLQNGGLDIINTLALCDILEVPENSTDALMKALCYDEDGNRRTIGDLIENGSDLFNEFYLCDILNVPADSTDALMKSLCYDDAGNKRTIGDLIDQGSDLFTGFYLCDILDVPADSTDALMKSLCYDDAGNKRTIGDLIDQGSDLFTGFYLCDILDVPADSTDALMKALCYKEDGSKYTIGDLMDDGSAFFDDLKLCDILNVPADTTDATMKALCYEEDGTPRTIADLKNGGSDLFDDLKLCDVLNITRTSDNTLLKAICFNGTYDRTIADLKTGDFFNDLKLCDVLDITRSSDNALLKAICFNGDLDRTIEDLKTGDFFDDLKLCDVMDIDRTSTNALLKAICFNGTYDRTIADLKTGDFFNDLKLCDVLDITRSSDNALLKAICFDGDDDRTIEDLKTGDFFKTLKLCDILEIDETSDNALLKALCFDGNYARTIEDLQNGNFLEGLKLCDALDVDRNTDNALLKALCFNGDYERTIGDLKNDPDFINTLKLCDVLGVDADSDNALMKALCFNGTHERTIGELKEGGTSFFDDILLSDLLNVDPENALIMSLIYGKKDVHYTIQGEKIVMLQKRVAIYNNIVFDEYGHAQIAVDYDAVSGTYTVNGVTYKTKADATLGTVTVKIAGAEQQAQFFYVLDAEGNDVMFDAPTLGMLTAEDSPLLNNAMDHLTVADILGDAATDGNTLLSLIGHCPISDMAEEVEKLLIVDVFETDIYYTNEDGEFTDAEGNVLSDQTLRLDEYVQPTWKYLLMDENGVIDTSLTITDGMTTMMDNMTRNIQNATLRQLVEDDILVLEGAALIKYNTNPDAEMFSWTLPQAIDKMFQYMALVEQYQGMIGGGNP